MYIRTDFHIYEIKSEEIIQGEKYYNIEIQGGLNKLKAEFGKQSENLAELCDRYVGISNNKPMIIKYEFDEYYDEYGDTYTKEELLIEYDIIYGAIYTDKGLIYVAKMNDKGELELI